MKEVVLDCMGEACPVPLIRAEKEIAKLQKGDMLVVQIDHSCAMKNVPEWAKGQGYDAKLIEIADSEWEVEIIK